MTPDLVITGRVWTLAGDEGLGAVAAIAVGEGSVLAAGREADVTTLAGPRTRRLTLGREWVVLPGVTDAHLHAIGAALAASEPDVTSATDLDGVLALLAAAHRDRVAAGDRSRWLVARGWSRAQLGAWPHRDALESAAPGRPIFVEAHDGHAAWGSPAAFRAAGIDRSTPDPAGGVILRDADGDPAGVVLENAVSLLASALPEPDDETVARAVAAYAGDAASRGIVGWHDPGEPWGAPLRWLWLMDRAVADGDVPQRVVVSVRERELAAAIDMNLRSGARVADVRAGVRFGWLKLFADGTLGSRTAAMLDPYVVAEGEDPPPAGPRGRLLVEPDALADSAATAARAGIATQIHAIGDRGVRVALDALLTAGDAATRFRPRLEHVQAIAPDDVRRMAAGGVVASVQPIHLRSDARDARVAWADRLERAYPWRSLAASGVTLAFGSDAPIEPADPWTGIAVAVRRHDRSWGDQAPLAPEERLDLSTALRAACVGPLVAAGEPAGGRLQGGSRADLVVVPVAPFRDRQGDPATARPVLTLIGGREVYRDPAWDEGGS